MMPSGQVRPLVRQGGIQLAVVEAVSAPVVSTIRRRPGRQYTAGRSPSMMRTSAAGPGLAMIARTSSWTARRRLAAAAAEPQAHATRLATAAVTRPPATPATAPMGEAY